MNAQQVMPLPNPKDWITRAGAAAILGVDVATVTRMITDGRLTLYWPRGAANERRPTLLWVAEVEELKRARDRAAGRG